MFVRTFQGDFTSDFPVQLPEGQNARSGSKRFNFTLGSGSARIELQSFGGDIVLARKTITSREEERRRRREGLAPVAQPPQPGQPPQPSPAPTPKPPKPPGWDEQAIEEWAESFANEFEEKFGKEFEQTFEKGFEKEFERTFEKNFGKEFEQDFEEQFQESLKEWKLFSKTPSPKAKIR